MAVEAGIEDLKIVEKPELSLHIVPWNLIRLRHKTRRPVSTYEMIVVEGKTENFEYVKEHQSFEEFYEIIEGSIQRRSSSIVSQEMGKDTSGKTQYEHVPIEVLHISGTVIRMSLTGEMLDEQPCDRIIYGNDATYTRLPTFGPIPIPELVTER